MNEDCDPRTSASGREPAFNFPDRRRNGRVDCLYEGDDFFGLCRSALSIEEKNPARSSAAPTRYLRRRNETAKSARRPSEDKANADGSGTGCDQSIALWKSRVVFDPARHVGWDAEPAGKVSMDWGTAWIQGKTTLLAEVPSVIVPEEHSILINPGHPAAAKLTAVKVRKWRYDQRLK